MSPVWRAAAGVAAIALWSASPAGAAAQAPAPLTPPAPQAPAPAARPAAKPAPSKPAPTQAAPAAAAPSTPAAPRRDLDLAYGAFQRGHYLTALSIATRRVDEQKDVKAMTLLGELYANGLGVERDDKRAAEWYRLAAERGDREAMFA
ncbi:MAG TPA: SEL1-like repeat protein, partial [Xanthobacteraceae bacterium]